MAEKIFDYTSPDVQAMPVMPVSPDVFDSARYADFAAQCDERYAAFLHKDEGVAVWQRVRVAEVFRDGCRDMAQSLRWQLGGLNKTMNYLTDAPTYLEPWYGIGTTAAAFGAEYVWPEGQAPVVEEVYNSIQETPPLLPRDFNDVAIMRHTLHMIEYFLEETQGRIPLSWSDIQNPLNVATELVNISAFFLGMGDVPHKVQEILTAITEVVIGFTQVQSRLIGDALARPGHGFASARTGTGIGMSTDNLVMISPRAYEHFCVPHDTKIGAAFGGAAIHSCGKWSMWLDAVKKIPNLTMVDAAFGPQTDPVFNEPEAFRDAFANTGVIVQARMVGDPGDVLAQAKRLAAPGVKLIIVTYVQDPQAQRQLYHDLHSLCAHR
ncbi:MAG: hypothetical protein GXP37_14925 [Chloroflexi bacterium]|nr:hypothetical protein [Chloroflexota bacterium]